jgi:hypothetical protein
MFGLSGSESLAVGSGVIALVFWLFWAYAAGPKFRWQVGDVKWDFTKSWASTLTAVGALLGTTLSAGSILGGAAGKSEFGGLNLLFGFMVVLAPLFYQTTRYVRAGKFTTDGPNPGMVWSFLIANALTFWAVLGEVATIFVLARASAATQGNPGLTPLVALIFQLVVGFGLLVILLYAGVSVPTTINAIATAPPTPGKEELAPEIQGWSLM